MKAKASLVSRPTKHCALVFEAFLLTTFLGICNVVHYLF